MAGYATGNHEPVTSANQNDGFRKVLSGVTVYLDEAVALCMGIQKEEEEALANAVQQNIDVVKAGAEETFVALTAIAASLLPKIADKQPLPSEDLRSLNAALLVGESRYPFAGAKSDVIPPALLAAEPGAKLYANLFKKVEALCSRSLADMQKRETESLSAWLLEGGHNNVLDVRREELVQARSKGLSDIQMKHVQSLSQSDHLPICESVVLSADCTTLKVLTWNVMEFPLPGAKEPVLDGVSPYCDQLLRSLERKGTLERKLLVDAMASEAVVKQHAQNVVKLIREHMELHSCDVALLQEINSNLQAHVQELCTEMGWSACFSTSNADPKKCAAITCVVSKQPFEESVQVEVNENKKVRNFAAARRGDVWFVSCHVPVTNSKKGEGPTDVAMRVLEQLSARFPTVGSGPALVVGGDWNADVQEVGKRSIANPFKTFTSACLYAPNYLTCLGADHYGLSAIDGIMCLR